MGKIKLGGKEGRAMGANQKERLTAHNFEALVVDGLLT